MSLDDLFALERGDETPIQRLSVYLAGHGEIQLEVLRDGRVRWFFADDPDMQLVELLRANGHDVTLGGVM